jgi:hypothetical protein
VGPENAVENRHVSISDQTSDEAMQEHLEWSLEEALKDTFPASDAINVVQPPPKPTDKPRSGRRK